jgi:Papain family cysteine protease
MKKFVNFAALTLVAFIAFSCQKDITPTKEIFGTGLNPNTPASLEKVPEADFDENKLNLPASFAFDGPPIENQKQTSRCVGFSGAYYIVSLYNGVTSSGQNYDKAGSPEFAYAYYKKINNDDCNKGCYMFDEGNVDGLADILKNVGTSSWNQTPFANSNTCTITTDAQKTQAASNKIGGYARLDEDEYKLTKELKSWMYAGYPLWFAVNLDDGFEELGSATWSKLIGNQGGGHAMTLVGWDDSRKAFKIANSWGTDLGDKGYWWVDYDYFQVLLAQNGGTIGVLFPNESQKTFFNKLTPSSCGNAAWGELVINNKLTKEVKIVISGTTPVYLNDGTSIDASESESYYGLPKGDLKVKVTDSAGVLIKEVSVTITQCQQAALDIN